MTYKTFEEWFSILPPEYMEFVLSWKGENAPMNQVFFSPRLAFDACIERPRVDPEFYTLTNILQWVERHYAYTPILPELPNTNQ